MVEYLVPSLSIWYFLILSTESNKSPNMCMHTRAQPAFYFPSSDILKCASSNTSTEACWDVRPPSAVQRLWGYCSHYKSPVESRRHWSHSAVVQQFIALWSVLAVLVKAERNKEVTLSQASYLLTKKQKKQINAFLRQNCFLKWIQYWHSFSRFQRDVLYFLLHYISHLPAG